MPCAPGTPDFGDEDLLSTPNCADSWSLKHRFICKPHDLAVGLARQIALKGVKPLRWVVKLNQGFSGKGNACLYIEGIQNTTYRDIISGQELAGKDLVHAMANDIEKEFPNMKYQCTYNSWHGDSTHVGFAEQMSRLGAIAEAFVEGETVTSPSVQAIIDPLFVGKQHVNILSTHEQVRGILYAIKHRYSYIIYILTWDALQTFGRFSAVKYILDALIQLPSLIALKLLNIQ